MGWEKRPNVDPIGMIKILQDARGIISQNISTVYLEIKLGYEKKRLRFFVMKELAVPGLKRGVTNSDYLKRKLEEAANRAVAAECFRACWEPLNDNYPHLQHFDAGLCTVFLTVR
jgi:hypothetical protein